MYQESVSPIQKQLYIDRLKSFFKKSENFEFIDGHVIYSKNSTKISEFFYSPNNRFKVTIDATLFLKVVFNLTDIRLLFSKDPRTLISTSNHPFEFTTQCSAYCIETCKWEHDISFWSNDDSFDYAHFIMTIKQTCCGLVRYVMLIDDQFRDSSGRRSYCFRLIYESCDRSLDWETTKLLQSRLRENLVVRNRLAMR